MFALCNYLIIYHASRHLGIALDIRDIVDVRFYIYNYVG